MTMTVNLKQIYLYLKYVCFCIILCYFIVHGKLCATEMCFIFFIINIISVQVN